MERAGGQQLSKELKAKIVYLKNYTALTWEEIARECHCSVIADYYWICWMFEVACF